MKDLFLKTDARDTLFSLFSTVYPKDKAEEIADKLLSGYGTLTGLLSVSPAVLAEDIGKEAALYLELSLATCTRRTTERLTRGEPVTEARLVEQFDTLYKTAEKENVYAVLLDKDDCLLSMHRISNGSADSSGFVPKQVLELALREGASGVILTHNHPGGEAKASATDLKTTKAVEVALAAARIRFLGHYLFADGEFILAHEEKEENNASTQNRLLNLNETR